MWKCARALPASFVSAISVLDRSLIALKHNVAIEQRRFLGGCLELHGYMTSYCFPVLIHFSKRNDSFSKEFCNNPNYDRSYPCNHSNFVKSHNGYSEKENRK